MVYICLADKQKLRFIVRAVNNDKIDKLVCKSRTLKYYSGEDMLYH